MILHQLIHSSFNPGLGIALVFFVGMRESRHEGKPVRLNDFAGAKVEKLLHEAQHPAAQTPGSSFPILNPSRHSRIALGFVMPSSDLVVFGPGVRE